MNCLVCFRLAKTLLELNHHLNVSSKIKSQVISDKMGFTNKNTSNHDRETNHYLAMSHSND